MSRDLKTTIDHMADMAAVGTSLQETLADNRAHPLLKDWAPISDPAEIVGDLLNAYDELLTELADALKVVRRAGTQISAGLTYVTAEAKHQQLREAAFTIADFLASHGETTP